MKLLDVKKVVVGDTEFYLRYSNRALLSYVNSIKDNPNNYDAVIKYFYDLSKIGAKIEGVEFNYSLDDFDKLIDPYPDAIMKFNEAATSLFDSDKKK